jgi:hypothetical protein
MSNLVMAMSVAQYSGRYLKNHMRRARRICEPDIIKLNFPILFTKKNEWSLIKGAAHCY